MKNMEVGFEFWNNPYNYFKFIPKIIFKNPDKPFQSLYSQIKMMCTRNQISNKVVIYFLIIV